MADDVVIGKGNKLIYVIDLDEPDSEYDKNKLLKQDNMASFIWNIQHKLIFDAETMTGNQVAKRLIEMLEEEGLKSDELTF